MIILDSETDSVLSGLFYLFLSYLEDGEIEDSEDTALEEVLEQVLFHTEGYAMDDMTILVTGIWEKG